jgi:tripartite-type tricarboxylate transporter receptor subunit TctC
MKLPLRRFLHPAAGAAALPAVSRIASAQTYRKRPVRIVLGYSAGGPQDIVARSMGQWLSERIGRYLKSIAGRAAGQPGLRATG